MNEMKAKTRREHHFFRTGYLILVLLFIYLPIGYVMLFSFNDSKSMINFSGFSLRWYEEMINNQDMLESLKYTVIIAVIATVVSTVIGTVAAIGLSKARKIIRTVILEINNLPVLNPDIVTAIGLMLLFLSLKIRRSIVTMTLAHITFCIPYVILSVLPKLRQMDRSLPEAAMDLGCTPLRAFFKATLPEIMPGIVTGLLMAFTLSLDDFVISYFTAGNGFQTLPIRIYNMTKKTVTPKMYALATIIFFVILTLLLISNTIDTDSDKKGSGK
jgi:spermidine/putrescine transport system permease protein